MSAIYFIRHAQASFGGENYDRLSKLGIRQAQILGDHFANLGLSFQATYTGTMERQIDTAKTVLFRMHGDAAELDLRLREEFNEYDSAAVVKSQIPQMIHEDPSLSKMLSRIYTDPVAFQQVFERAVTRWISSRHDVSGTETWQAFTARVRQGVVGVMKTNGPKKRITVYTSGGAISAVMQMALGISDAKTIQLSWQIRNTSVSIFKYNREGIGLSSFNSVAHLEFQNDAELLTYR